MYKDRINSHLSQDLAQCWQNYNKPTMLISVQKNIEYVTTRDESTLLIVQSRSDIPDHSVHHAFVIDAMVNQMTDEQYHEIESKLRTLDVDSGTSLPLYKMFGFIITSGHRSSKFLSLPIYIYLVNKLQAEIQNNEIDEIIVTDIDSSIEPLIIDIAESTDVVVRNKPTIESRDKLYNKITSFFWTIPILLDQLLAIATSRAKHNTAETVFVPSGSRFKSMKPVLEQMTTDYSVVLKQAVISKTFRGFVDRTIEKFEPTLAHQYSSGRCVLSQIRYLLFEYVPDELLKDTTETELARSVNQEFDTNLDTTIGHIFETIYENRSTNNILHYFVYREVLRKTEAANIVVGLGYGPRSEAIWLAAQNSDVEAYDLPHTITLNPPQTGVFSDYTFVTGEFAEEYMENNQPITIGTTEVLPTGRPYLERLEECVGKETTEITEPVRILIATQPFSDVVRTAFIEEVTQSIEKLPAKTETIVKLHPAESREFYEELNVLKNGFTIETENLWNKLQNADIVLTINSNVGLEAIITDCLSININLSSFGNRRPFPYAIESPTPILTSQSEMQTFFESLTPERMDELKEKQYRSIKENYNISGSAKRIASKIED